MPFGYFKFSTMFKDFCIWVFCIYSSCACFAQSPFGRHEQEVARDQLTIDISNKAFRQDPEQLAAYESIYMGFIEKNAIDDEGQFSSGGSSSDSASTRAYFMDYVSKNRMQQLLTVARRCKNCRGNAKIWVKTDPENPLSLSKVEVDCPECPSDGRIPTEVTFTLVCSSKAVPPLPEKPRVIRQRLLVEKANAGDSFSQVDYAVQLEGGTKTIDQNVGLARDYFVKAAVQGNGHGLDGAVRTIEASSLIVPRKEDLIFMLKLVQAKLAQEGSGKASYYVNANELGVSIPSGMSYIDVKAAEILARTFRSYFLSKDLEPRHFSYDGALGLLRPIKKQMEKAPIVAARAKVEYVLISQALTAPVESLDSDRLSLIKEASVSLDPTAFGILGDVSSAGINGPKNSQAASIFYKISQRLTKDSLIDARLDALQSRYDRNTTDEMVEEFEKTKVAGRANINFIEAMLKINAQKNDLQK
jgi:hypothetical protein